jgi:hypothetical protein
MNWIERVALWLFGKEPVKRTPVADTKVASNIELLKLLNTEIITERFFDSMTEHIRENGLTFSERDLVAKVIDRVSARYGP